MYLANKKKVGLLTIFLSIILFSTNQLQAQHGEITPEDTLTKSVLIHPVIDGNLVTTEHTFRPKLRLGDQLARDFTIGKITEDGIFRRYKNDGKDNSDWYTWRKNVLAPFDATVIRVNHPDSSNSPGVVDREAPTGFIIFQHKDSTKAVYAHVREIDVEKGDQVNAGEVVAKVGNNGTSRLPHVHVGAWKNETPLQIQVDLYSGQRSKKNTEMESK